MRHKRISKKDKKILLEKFIKKRIGLVKFKRIDQNKNLIKDGEIDSLDFADIYSFIEKDLKTKINFFKIFGKNANVTLKNIYKCIQ